MNPYWISFSSGVNLGCCIVDANSPEEAVIKTKTLGINPGGQAMAYPLADDAEDLGLWPKDTLISREQLVKSGYLPVKDFPVPGSTIICEECQNDHVHNHKRGRRERIETSDPGSRRDSSQKKA